MTLHYPFLSFSRRSDGYQSATNRNGARCAWCHSAHTLVICTHTLVFGLQPHTLLTHMLRDGLMSARHDSTAALLENLPVLLMPTAQRRSRCCVRDYSKLVFITRPLSPCCIRSDQLRTLNNGAPSYAASTTSTAEYLSGLLLLHTGLPRAGYGVVLQERRIGPSANHSRR